jgi:hypothetical protein
LAAVRLVFHVEMRRRWRSWLAVRVAVVPTLLIGGPAAGVIVGADFVAIAPALAAARSKMGDLLQTPQLNAL